MRLARWQRVALIAALVSLPWTGAALGQHNDRDTLEAELKVTVGIAYMNHGDYREALTRFEEAKSLSPEDGTARFMAATALNRLGRYDEALADLAEAQRLGAEAPPGRIDWFTGEAHYWLGDYDAAEASFRQALTADPRDAFGHFYLGLTLLNQDRADTALTHLQRAEELNPRLAGTGTFYAGKAHFASGDVDQAVKEFEKALSSSDSSDNARKAASNYLSALQAKSPAKGPPKWELSFSMGAEADDNLLVLPDDPNLGTTGEGASRLLLTMKTSWYPFYDRNGWSMGLILNAYQSIHDDKELEPADTAAGIGAVTASQFDLTAPQGIFSVTWGKDPQGWVNGPIGFTWVPMGRTGAVFTLQYGVNYYWLDGQSYLRTTDLGTSVKINEGRWTATQIDLDYRNNAFMEFDARSGTFAFARVMQYFFLGRRDRQIRLGLRFGTNDADGTSVDLSRTSGEFCSVVGPSPNCIDVPTEERLAQDGGIADDFDYDETEIWVDSTIALPARLSLFLQMSFQNQQYDNISSNPTLRGPNPDELREDDRLTASASLVWGFSKHWSLITRYIYYDNSSNKSFFEYTRGVASLGVNWYF